MERRRREKNVTHKEKFNLTGANRGDRELLLIDSVFSVASCKELTRGEEVSREKGEADRGVGFQGSVGEPRFTMGFC